MHPFEKLMMFAPAIGFAFKDHVEFRLLPVSDRREWVGPGCQRARGRTGSAGASLLAGRAEAERGTGEFQYSRHK